ncbi:uncharacterized protein LOC118755371 [Rhagoletis pomonella]|uniref:uncharacterized protein LOC118755371 n=1 Tax=Rhagoletis pomonella TaxID=28610 RepID=UPI001786E51B|nr:uncharacterized protein LOC118755371 [Rhagoletis pomonella]
MLSLNQPQPQLPVQDPHATVMPTSDASFDLLGAFVDDNSSGIGSAPIPDILEINVQPTSNANLDDIFGSVGSSAPKTNLEFDSVSVHQPTPTSANTSATTKVIPTWCTSWCHSYFSSLFLEASAMRILYTYTCSILYFHLSTC